MPEIYRGDVYGLREHKYGALGTTGVTNTEWAEVEPMSPFYLFAEVDAAAAEEYVKGVSLPYIAPVNNVGIVTSRDRFVVDYSLDDLKRRIYDFLDANKTDAEVANKYLSAKDKLDVSEAREVINKRGRHTFA
ncbi:MAG: hypothetical protein JSW52_10175 [Candidatus Coatesbacteria bacterium]|nr:MAG: hypothetical protein JSW52_10175 [Candidatus Coatesbacteria bacterium]